MLTIENLECAYGKAKSLHGVSLNLRQGEIAAIIGPVGAGKSTMMDAIMGLKSSEGRIEFEGQSLEGKSTAEIVQQGIAYAPERGNLFTQMSVRENLLAGGFTSREHIDRNLDLVFQLFPVLKERQEQETGTQSGGERQMVSLGRAMMSSPRLLLVDEPTIGLSPKVCLDIARTLRSLNETHGLTILIAEQNVNFALSLAERIYLIETGRIIQQGTSETLGQKDEIRKAYFGDQS